eukprot:CAMPEP_0117765256 /NCGR_PEP_ID=MMETSP0947-20121206/19989_1 /TAXON_ID=44440 /ORGANISM="Chattonella subsalsa, Strain CCMP2191" /LENGTH=773 /DNA_ID=CAMNT_0005587847 /DNA_START=157 /DNA_END=2478 /DNA_ORIENTATION=-
MRRNNSFSIDMSSQVSVPSRQRIVFANRIVVKAGTSTVSNPDGTVSLRRVAAIVEQICHLREQGKEVILISSGATGIGKNILKSAIDKRHTGQPYQADYTYDAACAGAGQLGLMTFYDALFKQKNVNTSQLLLTAADLQTFERKSNICYTLNTLLGLGIIPILNENDAVSANRGYEAVSDVPKGCFSDNDGLASLVAKDMNAQLLIILTDVNGLYTLPPSDPRAQVIHTYCPGHSEFQEGKKSTQGRGGIHAKITAAVQAAKSGVPAVVIANGKNPHAIEDVCAGYKLGTLVTMDASLLEMVDRESESSFSSLGTPNPLPVNESNSFPTIEEEVEAGIRRQAETARAGGRALLKLSSEERSRVLSAVAEKLSSQACQEEILAANAVDLQQAEETNLEKPLLNRLKLTEDKLQTLADGIQGLANIEEPVGRVLSKLEVSEGLELQQQTVPIGVLLIIFESRPDSLPQIASLALRSGNGLLLKGGKEAENSNRVLHRIITEAVVESSGGKVPAGVIGLVEGRAQVAELLKLDDLIDLCIPRGSNSLVKHIKSCTRIPVLGHADGICHVYVDKDADPAKACAIAVDAKTNYPAACNAAETVLFHRDCVASGLAAQVMTALRQASVTILGGPKAVEAGLVDTVNQAETMGKEYGNTTLCAEVVEDMEGAIDHIHKFGSGHTETIVTENKETAEAFLDGTDSACVFHNASTRFSDGYRFGLGAEVGISTGRIHSRGPVGVEGLLTTKYIMKSSTSHTVTEFSEGPEKKVYTHRKLPIS